MKLRFDATTVGVLGFALLMAHSALAQTGNPVGTINATIDGTAYEGETLDVPSEGTATAEAQSFGPVTSLSIQAHDPQAESIMRNVLSVQVSFMGEDLPASIMEASVSWWPDGMSEPFYISDDSGTEVKVALDTLSLEDESSAVAGTFSALLCRKDSFFAETDTSDCKMVEGTFDTLLRKVE